MKKFEYYIWAYDATRTNNGELKEMLDDLGNKGWEVCHIENGRSHRMVKIFMKREINQ